MQWMYLHVATLDSDAMVDAEPVDRATWLMLMRYCVGQENLGRISGAKSWGDRKWQQACKVTLREVLRTCRLWTWDGDDLQVEFYPAEKQREMQRKSEGGHKTASKRWGKQPNEQRSSPDSSATPELPSSPDSSATQEQYAEGKLREGKLTPQTPQGGDSRPPSESGDGRGYHEVPSWAQVFDFVEKWPGEPASGAPKIPTTWAEKWYARLMRRTEPPMDWQRLIVADWRARFREHLAGTDDHAPGRNGSAKPVSPELRRLDASRRIEALTDAVLRSSANANGPCWNLDCTDEEREKLAKMRAELKRLREEMAAV